MWRYEMAQVACDYFADFFTSRGWRDATKTLSRINVHATNGMNTFPCSPFTEEETGMAVRSIHPIKTLGWDV